MKINFKQFFKGLIPAVIGIGFLFLMCIGFEWIDSKNFENELMFEGVVFISGVGLCLLFWLVAYNLIYKAFKNENY